MKNIAYLRVSTNKQDTENQKFSILNYCNGKNLHSIDFIEDACSGKLCWRQRSIGEILNSASVGSNIIVSEISRLGRSALQVLEILEFAAQNKICVHIAKNGLVMDSSISSTITATMLGLAAQIEREFISTRTRDALARLKDKGIKLGRPKGQASSLKLDENKEQIIDFLKKGVSKRSIAKIVECSPSTLYSWIKRRKISGLAKKL